MREYVIATQIPDHNSPDVRHFKNILDLESALFDSRNEIPEMITIEAGVLSPAPVEEFKNLLQRYDRTKSIQVRIAP